MHDASVHAVWCTVRNFYVKQELSTKNVHLLKQTVPDTRAVNNPPVTSARGHLLPPGFLQLLASQLTSSMSSSALLVG